MLTPSEKLAQRLALGVPALLLGGAYLSQYGFGLVPCEMCWWQRYPHFAAVALALLSTVIEPRRLWIALAVIAVLVSGLVLWFKRGSTEARVSEIERAGLDANGRNGATA